MSYKCQKCGMVFNSKKQAKCGRCAQTKSPLLMLSEMQRKKNLNKDTKDNLVEE